MRTEPTASCDARGFFYATPAKRTDQTSYHGLPVAYTEYFMALTTAQIADLFSLYRDELMRRLIGMVHSRDTAADLMQDTYVRLLRITDAQPVEQPRALLHRIARNLAIDYLRARKNGPNAADPLETALDLPCPVPTQERALLGKERLQMFIQAVEDLPPRTREAFVLYRVHEYSYREIAAHMGISLSGVDKHIRRAIEQTCASVDAFDGVE
ncbi:MAG: DNA-directed RNA polymerase sigma-70 factor [Nitrospira sp.]|nr:MAG: DNA-directed RNA polymerase sigma-70 factor [Nitrospira sp.]